MNTRPTLNRADYERHVLTDGAPTEGLRRVWPDLSEAERIAILRDAVYPKRTSAAIAELRARGVDATAAGIENRIRKGQIPQPSGGEGRNRLWTTEDIDRLFEVLVEEGMLTPGSVAFDFFGISAAQFAEAVALAEDAYPETPRDQLVLEVQPHAIGAGVPGVVKFRSMTDAERGARDAAIAASKRKGGE